LENPYESYRELDEMLEAPEGHWLHNVSCDSFLLVLSRSLSRSLALFRQ